MYISLSTSILAHAPIYTYRILGSKYFSKKVHIIWMFCQVVWYSFNSFFQWVHYFTVWVYHNLSNHSFLDGIFCFQFSASLRNAMIWWLHVQMNFLVLSFIGYILRGGIIGSKGMHTFNLNKCCQTDFIFHISTDYAHWYNFTCFHPRNGCCFLNFCN